MESGEQNGQPRPAKSQQQQTEEEEDAKAMAKMADDIVKVRVLPRLCCKMADCKLVACFQPQPATSKQQAEDAEDAKAMAPTTSCRCAAVKARVTAAVQDDGRLQADELFLAAASREQLDPADAHDAGNRAPL